MQIISADMKDEDTLCCGRELFNCKRLLEKKERYNSHLKFLQKCMKNKLTPKGFQIKWKFNLDAGIQSKRRVNDILADTSKHLLSEAIEVCRNELCKLENRISNLLSNMSTDKSSYMNDTIESIFREQTRKLTFTKERKFANLEKKTRKWSSTNKEYTKSKNSNVKHLEPEEIVNVVGDRNCFFRCISIKLFDTETQHQHIRQQIVDHMRKNLICYQEYISGNVQEHLVNMSKTDGSVQSYATDAEIAAASKLFNVDIFIQTLVNTKRERTKYSL